MKKMKELEYLSYEERLRELGMFDLEKKAVKVFLLNIKMTEHQHILPREAVESPSLEILEKKLSVYGPEQSAADSLAGGEWDSSSPRGRFQPQPF